MSASERIPEASEGRSRTALGSWISIAAHRVQEKQTGKHVLGKPRATRHVKSVPVMLPLTAMVRLTGSHQVPVMRSETSVALAMPLERSDAPKQRDRTSLAPRLCWQRCGPRPQSRWICLLAA